MSKLLLVKEKYGIKSDTLTIPEYVTKCVPEYLEEQVAFLHESLGRLLTHLVDTGAVAVDALPEILDDVTNEITEVKK